MSLAGDPGKLLPVEGDSTDVERLRVAASYFLPKHVLNPANQQCCAPHPETEEAKHFAKVQKQEANVYVNKKDPA